MTRTLITLSVLFLGACVGDSTHGNDYGDDTGSSYTDDDRIPGGDADGSDDTNEPVDTGNPSTDTILCYPDADGDGYGNGADEVEPYEFDASECPEGTADNGYDWCDDDDTAWTFDQCFPETGDTGEPSDVVDADGDGFDEDEDCDDTDADIHPGADEICNDVDDNCDGDIDEDDVCDDDTGSTTTHEVCVVDAGTGVDEFRLAILLGSDRSHWVTESGGTAVVSSPVMTESDADLCYTFTGEQAKFNGYSPDSGLWGKYLVGADNGSSSLSGASDGVGYVLTLEVDGDQLVPCADSYDLCFGF